MPEVSRFYGLVIKMMFNVMINIINPTFMYTREKVKHQQLQMGLFLKEGYHRDNTECYQVGLLYMKKNYMMLGIKPLGQFHLIRLSHQSKESICLFMMDLFVVVPQKQKC